MLGLKLNHVSKRGYRWRFLMHFRVQKSPCFHSSFRETISKNKLALVLARRYMYLRARTNANLFFLCSSVVLVWLITEWAPNHYLSWMWCNSFMHTVGCCYNAVQYDMVLHTSLQLQSQDINLYVKPQTTPHINGLSGKLTALERLCTVYVSSCLNAHMILLGFPK